MLICDLYFDMEFRFRLQNNSKGVQLVSVRERVAYILGELDELGHVSDCSCILNSEPIRSRETCTESKIYVSLSSVNLFETCFIPTE
jgi:hypothetical protein